MKPFKKFQFFSNFHANYSKKNVMRNSNERNSPIVEECLDTQTLWFLEFQAFEHKR